VNWWDSLWHWAETSQLGATIVGGVMLAIILAVPKWRVPVFGAVGRFVRWLGGLRVVSKNREAAKAQAAIEADALRQSGFRQQLWAKNKEIAKLETKLKDETTSLIAKRVQQADDRKKLQEQTDKVARLAQELQSAKKDRERFRELIQDSERQLAVLRKERDELESSLSAAMKELEQAKAPMASGRTQVAGAAIGEGRRLGVQRSPRWQVCKDIEGDRTDWLLTNHAEGAVATQVVLTSLLGNDFTFTSDAAWDDVTGVKTVAFTGFMSDFGRKMGAKFLLVWVDENGARRRDQFTYTVSGR
jgi:hypothetical protein